MKKNNDSFVLKLIGLIFTLVGGVFTLVAAFTLTSSIKTSSTYIETEAVLVTYSYDPYEDSDVVNSNLHASNLFRYSIEGTTYVTGLNYDSSTWDEGDTITILVNPNDYTDINPSGIILFLLPIVFGCIGLPFLIIGIVFFVIVTKRSINSEKLKREGNVVYGVVSGFRYNYHYTVNGMHPTNLEIDSKNPVTGVTTLYKSGNVWENGQRYVGKQVTIYVDPSNPKKYFVDVDSINLFDDSVVDYR